MPILTALFAMLFPLLNLLAIPPAYATAGDDGDFNNSGAIDLYDFTTLVSHFSQTNCTYNLTNTCKIDTADISLLASHFGGLIGSGGGTADVTKWYPYTLSFTGPQLDESDNPSPFLNYRLNVTFTSPSGTQHLVPGFFAADGNAATTHATAGKIWQVRFAPDEVGSWQYTASFRTGTDVAISTSATAGSATSFDGQSGTFTVGPVDPNAPGFLKYGLLEYVGQHYLKFRDGPYFIKGGTDSPENFLGYDGFDNTRSWGGHINTFIHRYPDHVRDWQSGDPLFTSQETGYSSKGIIGALNYLSSIHVNSIYFLPMNLGGDGQDSYPYAHVTGKNLSDVDKLHLDVSKLEQWNQVFEHANRKGIKLVFQLAETENWHWLDGGSLGPERKLFYREMVARFSHNLAIKWILSEESRYTSSAHLQFAGYIQDLDPYDHPIATHPGHNNLDVYNPLYGDARFSASSMHFSPDNADDFVESIRANSANAGQPWIADMDEHTAIVDLEDAIEIRKRVIWDVFLSGGQYEAYLGYYLYPPPPGGDVSVEDFRTRGPLSDGGNKLFDYVWYARKFVEENLPFPDMTPNDGLVKDEYDQAGTAQVFYQPGKIMAIYFPSTNPGGDLTNGTVDLTGFPANLNLRWYSPRTGQFVGNPSTITGGGKKTIPAGPTDHGNDWVALIEPK